MENTNQPQPKKSKLPAIIIALLVLGAGGFYAFKKITHAQTFETTDNAQIESNAVPVISRIAGYIDTLNATDYQNVKAGDLLVKIDVREQQIAEQQAFADLLTAQADLVAARAGLTAAGATRNVAVSNKDVQQVRLEKAMSDMKRDEAMFNDGSITKKQYEDSKANYETTLKQLQSNDVQITQAGTQTGTAAAQIQKAEALIKVREAALKNTQLKLSYASVTAPVAGRLGKVNVQPGQYIQPGQALFTIVNNEQFWIVANFKETQLEKMRIGQPVDIKMDGYPDQKITGKVAAFSEATGSKFSLLPPDNSTGNFVKVTQRVPVKIEIDNAAALKQLLRAGLSVEVEVRVK